MTKVKEGRDVLQPSKVLVEPGGGMAGRTNNAIISRWLLMIKDKHGLRE